MWAQNRIFQLILKHNFNLNNITYYYNIHTTYDNKSIQSFSIIQFVIFQIELNKTWNLKMYNNLASLSRILLCYILWFFVIVYIMCFDSLAISGIYIYIYIIILYESFYLCNMFSESSILETNVCFSSQKWEMTILVTYLRFSSKYYHFKT